MQLSRLAAKPLPEHQCQDLIARAVALVSSIDPTCEIVLFGSAARGELTEASDIDLIVILHDDKDIRRFEKQVFTHGDWGFWPIDLLVYNRTYYEGRQHIGGVPFIALSEGRTVFPEGIHDKA